MSHLSASSRLFPGARELILLLSVAICQVAAAQDIDLRRAAAINAAYPSEFIREPHIAAGWISPIADSDPDPVRAVAVQILNPGAGAPGLAVSYSERVGPGADWAEQGVIEFPPASDAPGCNNIFDPAVAYDPITHDFVAVSVGATFSTSPWVLVARYKNSTGAFNRWNVRATALSGRAFDKTWIVRGGTLSGQSKFYITGIDRTGAGANNYYYTRSVDGGKTWPANQQGRMRLVGGSYVSGTHLYAPAALDGGPLYIAYFRQYPLFEPGTRELRLVAGQDQPDGPDAMLFKELMTGCPSDPEPLSLVTNLDTVVGEHLPGSLSEPSPGLDLAVDPTNPNRLLLVYHDVVAEGSHDVDVYLRVLTRDPETDCWTTGERIRVNNDNPSVESDQFMPHIAVGSGKVHVIFYDDRNHDQDDGSETATPKFDAWYAWAPLTNLVFDSPERNRKLCRFPAVSPPCETTNADSAVTLDPALYGTSNYSFRDYIGITFFNDSV